MARMDQLMGLTPWSREFVRGNQIYLYAERVTRVYDDGREEPQPERPVYGRTVKKKLSDQCFEGIDGDQYPLHRYEFLDGRVYEERVQADRWYAGKQFYLALIDMRTGRWVEESLWREFLGDEEQGAGVSASIDDLPVKDISEPEYEEDDDPEGLSFLATGLANEEGPVPPTS